MLDDPMPGAALEAPDTFQRLAAPLWPRLPLALGYSGGARWVGCRSVCLKQVLWDPVERQGAS